MSKERTPRDTSSQVRQVLGRFWDGHADLQWRSDGTSIFTVETQRERLQWRSEDG